MPHLLTKRLKIMAFCAGVEFCAILVGMVSLGCFLTALFGDGPWLSCLLPTLLCAGVIAVCHLYPKHLGRNTDLSPYSIPIPFSDFDGICAALTAQRFEEDAAISFRKYRSCSVRLLVQNCPVFDQKTISARRTALNKSINHRHSISQWGSSEKVLKRLRINLVVYQHQSDAAVNWLRRDPELLLDRNESIVNAVICLDKQLLLLPACLSPMTWDKVSKYRTALELLVSNLFGNVEK